ncbi:MAG: restriction endonuclease [Desulfobulbus sp.]|nr:restriction endonuclease [Desulfobulbus sp.]
MDFIIKNLLEKLNRLKKERNRELSRMADIFGDPLEMAKSYIEPYCQHINPADYADEEKALIVTSPVLTVINTFIGRSTIAASDGGNQLILLSDTGMGKTTLLVMIKLAHLSSFWPKNYKCVLLKIGNDTLSEISKIERKDETVILLDSLDEYVSPTADSNQLLTSLLDATKNFKKAIITCRTQYTSVNNIDPFGRAGCLVHSGYRCPMIYLSPFNDSQVLDYILKKFNGTKSSEPVEKAKILLDRMGGLRQKPFLLSHIHDLVDSDIESWDEENIYSALVKSWLQREQRKIETLGVNSGIAIEEFHTACTEIASFMEKNNSVDVTPIELYAIIKNIPSINLIKTMDVAGRSFLSRDSCGNYKFFHKSIRDYFLKSKDKLLYEEGLNLPKEVIEVVCLINRELINYLKYNPKELYRLQPRQFEELVAEILSSYGWEVKLTPSTKDGGYDLFAIVKDISGVSTSWIVECKKYAPENKVGVDIVRGLWGVKQDLRVANAMLATTSFFTKGVDEFKSSRYDMELKDYEGLVEWINEYKPNPNGRLYVKDDKIVLPKSSN